MERPDPGSIDKELDRLNDQGVSFSAAAEQLGVELGKGDPSPRLAPDQLGESIASLAESRGISEAAADAIGIPGYFREELSYDELLEVARKLRYARQLSKDADKHREGSAPFIELKAQSVKIREQCDARIAGFVLTEDDVPRARGYLRETFGK